ncbi:MAG: DUF1223 domain-containing protein [Burkholderiales bacterium]|nr:DUF1223 domain-containing protein [Burkholderiales bacterium]
MPVFPNIAIAIFFVSLITPSAFAAGQCSKKSGSETAALLELYTSEGCNSCPPADKWVSNLAPAGFKASQIVPLAFHVDYWDSIGWIDRFAIAEFSGRHRGLARANGSGTVYTPQIFVSGKDIRLALSNVKLNGTLKQINPAKSRADIALALDASKPDALILSASASLADPSDDVQAYLAVYENKLFSNVKAGENRGVKLEHDYVVREFIGPLKFNHEGKLDVKQSVTLQSDWKLKDLGVAAFVQRRDSGETLQALQLPACM